MLQLLCDQENVSSKIIQNLLTITTQCTLNSTSQIHNLILWYPYLKTQCNSKMLLLKYIQTYLSYPDLLEGGAKGLIDCLIMKLRKQLSKRRKKSLGKICNMIFHGMFIQWRNILIQSLLTMWKGQENVSNGSHSQYYQWQHSKIFPKY